MENHEFPERIVKLVPEYALPRQEYLLAEGLDDLLELNARPAAGEPLLRVGLRIIPDAYDDGTLRGIPVSRLSLLAPQLRRLDALTVRGCFVRGQLGGLHGKELGLFFRACYESAKQMTVLLPCAMPYLCVEGGLAALAFNQREHPETLNEALTAAQLVAMQNRTAFYAKLLIT